jgi:surfeit locus 1 family protein
MVKISTGTFFCVLIVLAAFVTLMGLGNWQMQRLAWKLGLIAGIEERAYRPPMPISEYDIREHGEYSRLEMTGTFDHDEEMPLYAIGPGGKPGYHIYTPFHITDFFPVIVNRGWVPLELRDPATRPQGQLAGEITITGLTRRGFEPGRFTPDNNPDANDWYYPDPSMMARHAGFEGPVVSILIDADASDIPGGWPQGGVTRLVLSNKHLGYAITWYGLAATLAGVVAAWLWGRRRRQ